MIIFEEHLAELHSGSPRSWGSLASDTLTWESEGEQRVLALDEIVGAAISPDSPNNLPSFIVSVYPLVRSNIFQQRRRMLREYRFVCTDERIRNRWIRAINNTLRGVEDVDTILPPRHLHVILNPTSGNQNPREIFDRISSVLAASNSQWTLTETQEAGDAAKIAYNLPLDKIDGLVVVGGDGTVHEAINGLMRRSDWKRAIEIPIGTIPAGTGNGLCKTVLEIAGEPDDAVSAAFAIAKGNVRSFDLVRVQQANHRYYSILSLSWGLVSDVDIESERLRWLGSLRSDLYALLRILKLRTYRGRFSFVRAVTEPRGDDCHSTSSSNSESPNSEWQTIEDEFVLVWAMNLPWAAGDMKVAPGASAWDGAMEVFVVRQGVSKWRLLQALLQIADGSHTRVPGMEFYKVCKLQLEPFTRQGILAVDGEKVDYSPVKMEVLNGWIRVFGAN
ncbi:sphingosine kinase [Oscillatoriales cyanobacterium LEGE 11467]|uniref:Sphingosine kinase n=1 Tax=Zarconia navalis LEGE 11467 TaxID=1828826 RepID=A0A928W0Z6_9CYAN|nr:diacylglycerol kinase family protein [Zarconia navalis]MBE9041893.1 sphingosine kinase [Zarconia navalis LEGE 11467]